MRSSRKSATTRNNLLKPGSKLAVPPLASGALGDPGAPGIPVAAERSGTPGPSGRPEPTGHSESPKPRDPPGIPGRGAGRFGGAARAGAETGGRGGWPSATTTRCSGPTGARRRRPEEVVPAPRDEVPPRPQPGRLARRGAVQGGQGGLRGPLRPAEAGRLRPLRSRRVERRGARRERVRRWVPRHLRRRLRRHLRGRAWRGRGLARLPGRGSSLSLELDLEQAVAGDSVTIRVPTVVDCEACGGSGARPGTQPVSCETCGGNGQVRIQQGFFSLQQTCPRCKGRGKVIVDACAACRGAGKVREEKTLAVKIPSGVDNGDRIRLAGEGESGSRPGASGDLYVRDRGARPSDLQPARKRPLLRVPISFATATLGGEIQVPTLGGAVRLKVPGRDPDRRSLPPSGQGGEVGAGGRGGRSPLPGGGGDPGPARRAPEGAPRRVRRGASRGRRVRPRTAGHFVVQWRQAVSSRTCAHER